MYFKNISTPLGSMTATASEAGIVELKFTDSEDTDLQELEHEHLLQLRQELDEYFSGKRTVFTVPLAPEGSAFQKKVWNALLHIPYGETSSYEQQSKLINNPAAIRAVAAANGKNPIAILIPCHRVIGKNGKLTGYAGGLERKKWLLEHEGRELSLFAYRNDPITKGK